MKSYLLSLKNKLSYMQKRKDEKCLPFIIIIHQHTCITDESLDSLSNRDNKNYFSWSEEKRMALALKILLLKTPRCCVLSYNLWCSLSFWCPGDCDPPPSLHFAFPTKELNETSYKERTRLTYNCRPGYFKTSSKTYITCEGGSWQHENFCVSKYLFFYLCFFLFFLQSCLRN